MTKFPAKFTPTTIILIVAIFLVFVTLQRVAYVLLDSLHCKANFYFFQVFWGVLKFIIYVFVSFVFPSFLIDTLFTSVALCFLAHCYFFDGALVESFTSHNPLTYVSEGFLRVCFKTDIIKLRHFQYKISVFPISHLDNQSFIFF